MSENTVTQRLATERKIIAHLIDTMRSHGWTVNHVYDGGDECHNCATTDATLEHVFSVDESQIIFENMAGRQHWALIILGNGVDCITDYSYAQHRADNFAAIMEEHVYPFVEALL